MLIHNVLVEFYISATFGNNGITRNKTKTKALPTYNDVGLYKLVTLILFASNANSLQISHMLVQDVLKNVADTV